MNDYLGLLLDPRTITGLDVLIALGITIALAIGFFGSALLIINAGIKRLKPRVQALGLHLDDDSLERLFTQDSLPLRDGRTLKYRLMTNSLILVDAP